VRSRRLHHPLYTDLVGRGISIQFLGELVVGNISGGVRKADEWVCAILVTETAPSQNKTSSCNLCFRVTCSKLWRHIGCFGVHSRGVARRAEDTDDGGLTGSTASPETGVPWRREKSSVHRTVRYFND
jgi:hypothetical protein